MVISTSDENYEVGRVIGLLGETTSLALSAVRALVVLPTCCCPSVIGTKAKEERRSSREGPERDAVASLRIGSIDSFKHVGRDVDQLEVIVCR